MGTAVRSSWGKWGLCLLLFLATTLNYLDRQTLSILAPTLQDEMTSTTRRSVAVLRLLLHLHVCPFRGRLSAGQSPLAVGVCSGGAGVVRGFGRHRSRHGVCRALGLPASPGSDGVAQLAGGPANRVPRPAPRGVRPRERHLYEWHQRGRPDRTGADPGPFPPPRIGGRRSSSSGCRVGVARGLAGLHAPPRVGPCVEDAPPAVAPTGRPHPSQISSAVGASGRCGGRGPGQPVSVLQSELVPI